MQLTVHRVALQSDVATGSLEVASHQSEGVACAVVVEAISVELDNRATGPTYVNI